MCGICGIIAPSYNPALLKSEVKRMNLLLAHRGPDGDGVFGGEGFAFGHRRLSIIDIAGGRQPMVDKRGYVLTYNGEIYNYKEIRDELRTQGETFCTKSDSEVLLKAYIVWGKECLKKLNGIFAFAVINLENKKGFLARDRLGIKPLYYAVTPKGLAFGSEIKAVIACDFVDREIDLSLIPYYLGRGYFPREYTPFKAVRQLIPGHWLSSQNGNITNGCYWDIADICKSKRTNRATAETDEELVHLIRDSIKMQAVADVPIGTFLSGGLDSGIVTASLAKYMDNPIQTFTVGLSDDPSRDETRLAKTVADQYGTDHHEIHVKADDMLHVWDRLISHFDMPFSDTSSLPTYMISQFASNYVKVILSGDGGDEQWGGYGNYKRYHQLVLVRKLLLSTSIRSFAGELMCFAGSKSSTYGGNLSNRLKFYGGLISTDAPFLYSNMDRYITRDDLHSLAGERIQPYLDGPLLKELFYRDPSLHLDGVMLADLKEFMVDDVLRKVDMMSMAVGLEVRVPLLDHRVVEKSMEVSWRDKVTVKKTKVIIRRLFQHDLPYDILNGGKKGFSVPLDQWFRGPLREIAADSLLGKNCQERGIVKPKAVQIILDDHFSGHSQNGKLIADLMVLEKWLQTYDK